MTIANNTFAAACYNQNSIQELVNAFHWPSAVDMATWNLTADQYRAEVTKALAAKLENWPDRVRGFVPCYSADGWSLHRDGATDDEISSGHAPYIVSGPWLD